MARNLVLASVALALAIPSHAPAQWLNYKTPGIPRTKDGKPDLSAPAPKTADGKPDFTGLWQDDNAGRAETSKALDRLKPLPWAAKIAAERRENLWKDAPGVLCLPEGPSVNAGVGKIVQTPNLLLMLFGGTLYREIFLDGRDLPEDPNPDWMGYSVGHWEGDTLVIVTAGFNDKTWLDEEGHPHTEALRVTERLRRPDFGHLEMTKTMVDPGALAEPLTVPFKFELDADTQPLEYVCNENEKDRQHLVGKASDEKSVAVAPEVLAKYAGAYLAISPTSGRPIDFAIKVDGDHLVITGVGPTSPLIPVSQTDFAGLGMHFVFEMGDTGVVKDVILKAVEGDLKAARK